MLLLKKKREKKRPQNLTSLSRLDPKTNLQKRKQKMKASQKIARLNLIKLLMNLQSNQSKSNLKKLLQSKRKNSRLSIREL